MDRTVTTQFILTSQVLLHALPIDQVLQLRALDGQASRAILFPSGSRAAESHENEQLLALCDGHALTLRIVKSLVKAMGGAGPALRAIRSNGSTALRLAGRTSHDRTQSLQLCLNIAYEGLAPSSRPLLWALASLPAGVFVHHINAGAFAGGSPEQALPI